MENNHRDCHKNLLNIIHVMNFWVTFRGVGHSPPLKVRLSIARHSTPTLHVPKSMFAPPPLQIFSR